ncbi:MAG: hypothetical protein QM831_18570 [Kofleriaceae bacterium]
MGLRKTEAGVNEAIARFREAVMALDQPSWVEGTVEATLGIEVANRPAPMDDGLVDWLLERSEPAPFGHGQQTHVDPDVRATLRLKSRGRAKITGLDLDPIMERIESAFCTTAKLYPKLLDVLVYPTGGKFVRHKDTPRSVDQIGTLSVEVPSPHTGGAMLLDDHLHALTVDWSAPSAELRWVALFGDVDHEIVPVTSGHRITLVYTLSLTDEPRTDITFAALRNTLHDAIIALAATDFEGRAPTLYIPCTRLANTSVDDDLTDETLRGTDRVIAEALAACGVPVYVLPILIPSTTDKLEKFPGDIYNFAAIRRGIPPHVFSSGALTFTDEVAGDDEDGDVEDVQTLAPYVDWDDDFEADNWFIRPRARATAVFQGVYTDTGYFGNEASVGRIYKAVTLVIDLGQKRAPVVATKPAAPVVRRKKS